MTDDDLTLIATRIMDRVEKDGNGLQLTALIEELRAGLAIVGQWPLNKKMGAYNEFFGFGVKEQQPPPNAPDLLAADIVSEGTVRLLGGSIFWFNNGRWINVKNGTWLKVE